MPGHLLSGPPSLRPFTLSNVFCGLTWHFAAKGEGKKKEKEEEEAGSDWREGGRKEQRRRVTHSKGMGGEKEKGDLHKQGPPPRL